jgi:hypothetical protein
MRLSDFRFHCNQLHTPSARFSLLPQENRIGTQRILGTGLSALALVRVWVSEHFPEPLVGVWLTHFRWGTRFSRYMLNYMYIY